MRNKKTVCILGNYSGRNAGDAAILAGTLHDISSVYPQVKFTVPTLNPDFVRKTYGEYDVTPVNILPWTGSVKMLGLPTWKAIREADLVLVTDAILFDRGLWNPVHNYLSTLALWIPMARKRDIPIVLYNCSLGPVKSGVGRLCLRRILESADRIILRDEESKRLPGLPESVEGKLVDGADAALSAMPVSAERAAAIIRSEKGGSGERGRIGININSYGDAFVRSDGTRASRQEIISVIARAAEWIGKELKASVWLFGTQYMDTGVLGELRRQIKSPELVPSFTNRKYSYAELTGLLREVDLLVGMRTHSTILASSVGTPVIGIVTYPKTLGYMERIRQSQRAIPLGSLTFENLTRMIREVWTNRTSVREEVRKAVEEQRALGKQAVDYLGAYLG